MIERTHRALGALVAGMLCLSACSEPPRKPSSPAGTIAKAPPRTNEHIQLVDGRPSKDKTFSTHSLWITNCNYAVYTVGDPPTAPPMDTLRSDLADLDTASSQHKLQIDRYAVYYNPARLIKAGAWGGVLGGIPGALIATSMADLNKGASCPAEKMDGGWYGPGEISTANPPLIVEMKGTFDAKPFTRRAVYSPKREIGAKMKRAEDVAEYEAALHKANQSLFAAIGLTTSSPAGVAPSTSVATTGAAPPTRVATASAETPLPAPAAPQKTANPDDEGWINMPTSSDAN